MGESCPGGWLQVRNQKGEVIAQEQSNVALLRLV